jgi:hypothetical protein
MDVYRHETCTSVRVTKFRRILSTVWNFALGSKKDIAVEFTEGAELWQIETNGKLSSWDLLFFQFLLEAPLEVKLFKTRHV